VARLRNSAARYPRDTRLGRLLAQLRAGSVKTLIRPDVGHVRGEQPRRLSVLLPAVRCAETVPVDSNEQSTDRQ
jgi:hypothetical protein